MSQDARFNCKMLFWRLRRFHSEAISQANAITFIRELQSTSQCDHIVDLSLCRANIKEMIDNTDSQRSTRIKNYNETEQDKRVAQQALIHRHLDHKRILREAVIRSHFLNTRSSHIHVSEDTLC